MEEKRYWERVKGYMSELRVDARWVLREEGDSRAHGSLRIVSHPDLKHGYLRAFVSFVTSRRPKTEEEILQTVEEYKMDIPELEIYSIDEHITTVDNTYEAPFQELNKLFGVNIFE